MDPAVRIIVALDGMEADQARQLAASIPGLRWVKVGLELFVSAGPAMVLGLRDAGLEDCRHHNLSGGIVALHKGYRY